MDEEIRPLCQCSCKKETMAIERKQALRRYKKEEERRSTANNDVVDKDSLQAVSHVNRGPTVRN